MFPGTSICNMQRAILQNKPQDVTSAFFILSTLIDGVESRVPIRYKCLWLLLSRDNSLKAVAAAEPHELLSQARRRACLVLDLCGWH